MAINFTPKDVHTVMNLLIKQATGEQALTVTDASSFASAGELILSTGMENVFNSISIVFNRLIVAARPYTADLKLMDAENTGAYSALIRKISFYSDGALPTGALNTDLYTNLAEGFTAGENPDSGGVPQSTKSQWEQHRKEPLQMNFYSNVGWQYCITMDEDATKAAFTGEEEFGRFLAGYLMEHRNDIEQAREAWNHAALLNKVGSILAMSAAMNGSAVDLVALYNSENNTNYTGTDLRTTYKKEFLAFFVARVKEYLAYMKERNNLFHWSVPKTVGGVTKEILRHTPYSDLHVSMVLPEIFNPKMLDIDTQYQPVSYWQSISNRAAINVIPMITNVSTGAQEPASGAVTAPYVLALITDRDGLMTNFELERADTTQLEARKHYRNTWDTFQKGIYSDNTEKCILFYMAS